jgi:hypothetical protein
MKNKLLNILGFIWCLPVSILLWIFGLMLTFFGQIESIHVLKNLVFVWNFKKDSPFCKEEKWFGWSIGNNIFLYIDFEEAIISNSFIHELTHSKQNYQWGVFFLPAYIINTIWIWLLYKKKHIYIDNYFERQARKAAGQPIYIPRDSWIDGPNDRNPWW